MVLVNIVLCCVWVSAVWSCNFPTSYSGVLCLWGSREVRNISELATCNIFLQSVLPLAKGWGFPNISYLMSAQVCVLHSCSSIHSKNRSAAKNGSALFTTSTRVRTGRNLR